MTSPENSLEAVPGLYENLCNTLGRYKDHGPFFTGCLIKPVFLQMLGIYGCVIFSYVVMDLAVEHFSGFFAMQPFLLLLLVTPIAFGMIYLFCLGFWQYLLRVVSLSRNAREVLAGKHADYSGAYNDAAGKSLPYTSYLLVLVAIQAVPVFVYGLMIALSVGLGAMMGEGAMVFAMVAGTALAGLAFMAALVATVYFSLGFQVLAFEPVGASLLEIPRRSFALVRGYFWQTAALHIVWMMITTVLIPLLAIFLLQVLGIMGVLSSFHDWVIDLVLNQAQPLGEGRDPIPGYEQIYNIVQATRFVVADSLSSTLVSTTVTLLLLPLGTLSFTQLYLGILAERAENSGAAG